MNFRLVMHGIISVALLLQGCGASGKSEVVWKFSTAHYACTPPLLDAQHVYVGSDRLYCLNARSGTPVWEFPTYGPVTSSAAISGGQVYFQCGGLYCLDAKTGATVWKFWDGGWRTEAPVVSRGRVYSTAGDRAYCNDARTGKKLWQAKIGSLSGMLGAGDGKVFLRGGRRLYCLSAQDGRTLWEYELIDPWYFFAAAQRYVYVACFFEKKIYCLHSADGAVQWSCASGPDAVTGMRAGDGLLYVVAGRVMCLDGATGGTVWTFDKGGSVGRPFLAGKTLLVRSASKDAFRRLDRSSGDVLGRFAVPSGHIAPADPYIVVSTVSASIVCIRPPGAAKGGSPR